MTNTSKAIAGTLKRFSVILLAAIVAFGFGPWPAVFAEGGGNLLA
jgi:hypothetical protein